MHIPFQDTAKKTPRPTTTLPGTYYENQGGVEQTILDWLDKVQGFDKAFEKARPGKKIENSSGFKNLLRKIEKMNEAKISNIDNWGAFLGPSPKEMVKTILPAAIYKPVNKKELEKLLNEVL